MSFSGKRENNDFPSCTRILGTRAASGGALLSQLFKSPALGGVLGVPATEEPSCDLDLQRA